MQEREETRGLGHVRWEGYPLLHSEEQFALLWGAGVGGWGGGLGWGRGGGDLRARGLEDWKAYGRYPPRR
jgi:hypothetical protein